MKTEEIPQNGPSDWRREPSEEVNAIIGKLGEELSECATKCFRIMIQGLTECDPGDGRTNLDHFQDELADVIALVLTAQERLKLNKNTIGYRVLLKQNYKAPWFDALQQSDKENGITG